jgi:uncharacterized OB-fold protein
MEIAQHWRLNNQRYAMQGNECDDCGAKHFPPVEVCPECAAAIYAQSLIKTIDSAQVIPVSITVNDNA